jgi:hypothetical protein
LRKVPAGVQSRTTKGFALRGESVSAASHGAEVVGSMVFFAFGKVRALAGFGACL